MMRFSISSPRWLLRPLEPVAGFLLAVLEECAAQDRKWGWPKPARLLEDDPELAARLVEVEALARSQLDGERASMLAVLAEEVGEVAREKDPRARIMELRQVAAVCATWEAMILDAER